MATEYGKNWRLKFGIAGSPETFVTLSGEGSFDYKGSSSDVDTTDKDGPTGAYIPGRIMLPVKGNLKLPDQAFGAIQAAYLSGDPVDVEIVKGAVTKFAASCSIGNLNATFDSNGAVPFSFDMQPASTPTINDLTATA